MDRWIDKWVDRWMNGWMDGWMDGWMTDHLSEDFVRIEFADVVDEVEVVEEETGELCLQLRRWW